MYFAAGGNLSEATAFSTTGHRSAHGRAAIGQKHTPIAAGFGPRRLVLSAPPCWSSQLECKRMTNSGHESSMNKSADRVRQGVTGHNVRYVLFFSLLGLIIAFVMVAVFAS